MKESIFVNMEPVVSTPWERFFDFFSSMGGGIWIVLIALVIFILAFRNFYTSRITPGMTKHQKVQVFIDCICMLLAMKVAMDIVWNLAGYNKKK